MDTTLVAIQVVNDAFSVAIVGRAEENGAGGGKSGKEDGSEGLHCVFLLLVSRELSVLQSIGIDQIIMGRSLRALRMFVDVNVLHDLGIYRLGLHFIFVSRYCHHSSHGQRYCNMCNGSLKILSPVASGPTSLWQAVVFFNLMLLMILMIEGWLVGLYVLGSVEGISHDTAKIHDSFLVSPRRTFICAAAARPLRRSQGQRG